MRFNKKAIIGLVLCIGVFFMAVGYSILSTELKISGGANITSTWDVRITGITNDNATGSAYNLEAPSFTDDTAKFKVALVNPGDSMTYQVTIENKGTLTALLNSIDLTESGTDAIIYTVNGIKDGETLAAGATKTLTVTAIYNSNVYTDPLERARTLKVGLEWVQYTNQTIPDKTYTIAYNANGGSGTMTSQTCTVGSSCMPKTNTFTRYGHKYLGWSTTPDGPVINTMGSYAAEPGQTVTLYAVWKQLIFGKFNSSTYATLAAVDLTNDFSISVYFDVVHDSARKLIVGNYPNDNSGLNNFNIEMNTSNQLRIYQSGTANATYDITEGVHHLKVNYSKSSLVFTLYLDGNYLASLNADAYTSASKTASLLVGKDHRTGTSPFTTYMPVSDISFTSASASYNWELTPEGYVDTLTNTRATQTGTLTYYTK